LEGEPLSKREEILDMAIHALAPLMSAQQHASAYDLFDDALDIAYRLVSCVDYTAAKTKGVERDELLDMSVHALSALLKGRPDMSVDDLLGECMAVAQCLIEKVDAVICNGNEDLREELLDLAVHAQTAFLVGREQIDAHALAGECVAVAQALIEKVDGTVV
jgi:hypothetical protein